MSKKNRLDILIWERNSFFTKDFVNELIDFNKNSLMFVGDFQKVTVSYQTENIKLRRKTINILNTRTKSKILSPFLFLFDQLRLAKYFFAICFKYRPKVCWGGDIYSAFIFGIFRKIGLCEKSIYFTSDWFVVKNQPSLLSYVVNIYVFPLLDYFTCKTSDLVINGSEIIAQERQKYWGKTIPKKETLFAPENAIAAKGINPNKEKGNAICFVGTMRKDSGLDIVIKSLAEIRKKYKLVLKIIGPKSLHYDYFNHLSKEYNVEQYVKFYGFVEEDRFEEIFSDCFCGLSLLTTKESHSSIAHTSKLIIYLQYFMPIIASEGIAPISSSMVRDNKLGLIIEPSQEAFIEAVYEIYNKFEQYKTNIIKYKNTLPKTNIKEFLIVDK